jgi:hypothetical protein
MSRLPEGAACLPMISARRFAPDVRRIPGNRKIVAAQVDRSLRIAGI